MKMDDTTLRAILKSHIENATGNEGGEISDQRRRSMEYYLGEPFGNEIGGRSQVVSTDVCDTVESVMPDLMEIFSSGEEVVRFNPQGEEDVEAARHATEYVNYIWNQDNDGFNLFYDWFKDALLGINGFLKVYWDESEERTKHFYSGMTDDEFAILVADDEVEVLEHTRVLSEGSQALVDSAEMMGVTPEMMAAPPEPMGAPPEMMGTPPEMMGAPPEMMAPPPETAGIPPEMAGVPPEMMGTPPGPTGVPPGPMGVPPGPIGLPPGPMGLPPGPMGIPPEALEYIHDVKIERVITKGRVKVETLPPEEFLIERRTRSIADANFTCHRTKKTVSDLIQMGFDRKLVENLPSHDSSEHNEERLTRFNRDDEWPYNDTADESTREIWIYDSYLKIDYDDDGIAELRRIMTAGSSYEILLNEDADIVPFVSITPIRMPHKFYGRSLAELVEDIQEIKSTIWRQILDGMYNANNQRAAISSKVNLEDYLSNRIAAPVRVDTPNGDVGGHIFPLGSSSLAGEGLPLIEYADTVRETRTGVTRYGQGLDPDAMNTTARGMGMLLNRQQQRILLIARVFAEGGVKDAFGKILHLVVEQQDSERMVRLRGKDIKMDPRSWDTSFDMTISVGIGHGSQDQRLSGLGKLLEIMQTIVGYQGGAEGPLVGIKEIHNVVSKFIHALGFKNPETFLMDGMAQPPQPKPDPAMQKMQAELQLDQAKFQGELALKKQQGAQEHERKMIEINLEHMRKLTELGLEEAETKAGIDIKAAATNAEISLKRDAAAAKAAINGGESEA